MPVQAANQRPGPTFDSQRNIFFHASSTRHLMAGHACTRTHGTSASPRRERVTALRPSRTPSHANSNSGMHACAVSRGSSLARFAAGWSPSVPSPNPAVRRRLPGVVGSLRSAGCTTGVMVCFCLPALMYRAALRLQREVSPVPTALELAKQQFEEGCAVLMCILGVVCGVVSLAVLLSVKFDGSNGTNGVASG